MNNVLHPVLLGLIGNSMVSYVIEFFIALSVVALAVRGAMLIYDVIRTSWFALRTDVRVAKIEGVSILDLWKERIRLSTAQATRSHK